MRPRVVDVLGVPVAEVDTQDVLQFVRERVQRREPAQIVTVNAEFVMMARQNPEFARVLLEADLPTPDSFLIVQAMRRFGADPGGRVGGSDLIWQISAQAADEGFSVFLLGGAEDVADTAAARLKQWYPALVIAGTFSGSPEPGDRRFIVDLIRRSKADILFVAFGAPDQDIWIARNLRETGVLIAMGVGGSFDYVSGRVRRAPVWMRERGLEWLWRLIRQPWRWRRMLALPQFIWLMWRTRASNLEEERTN